MTLGVPASKLAPDVCIPVVFLIIRFENRGHDTIRVQDLKTGESLGENRNGRPQAGEKKNV